MAKRKITQKDVDEMQAYYDAPHTIAELKKKYKISHELLTTFLIKRTTAETQKLTRKKSIYNEVEKYYRNGHSVDECVEKYNIPWSTVKYHIKMRTSKKSNNFSFFRALSTKTWTQKELQSMDLKARKASKEPEINLSPKFDIRIEKLMHWAKHFNKHHTERVIHSDKTESYEPPIPEYIVKIFDRIEIYILREGIKQFPNWEFNSFKFLTGGCEEGVCGFTGFMQSWTKRFKGTKTLEWAINQDISTLEYLAEKVITIDQVEDIPIFLNGVDSLIIDLHSVNEAIKLYPYVKKWLKDGTLDELNRIDLD